MVKGRAVRRSCRHQASNKKPARYCEAMRLKQATAIAFPAMMSQRGLAGAAQATAFTVWFIPDLFDEALMALDAKLNDDIDE